MLVPPPAGPTEQSNAPKRHTHNTTQTQTHNNSWALDLQVEHSLQQLGTLSAVLLALLFLEAIVVQALGMARQFALVRGANAQHMRRFSVFLALPSATIRVMSTRRVAVDDDDDADDGEDDDELEVAAAATTARGGRGVGGEGDGDGKEKADGKEKGKSVRLAGVGDDDGAGGGGA